MQIPEGVEAFAVNITSNVDVGVELVKTATENEFIDYNSDRLNDMELLQIPGTLSAPLDLMVQNYASEQDTAVMSYRYTGIPSCPGTPLGCGRYDEGRASAEVRAWGCWARGRYGSASRAWAALGGPHALGLTGALPWHQFEPVWAAWPEQPGNGSWQYAFHRLDSDHNQQVAQEEFEDGYHLCSSSSTTTAASGSTSHLTVGGSVGSSVSLEHGTAIGIPTRDASTTSHFLPARMLPRATTSSGSSMPNSTGLSLLGMAGDWRPSTLALAVALSSLAIGLSTLLVGTLCCCSSRPKSSYRSIPELEDEVEEPVPVPERGLHWFQKSVPEFEDGVAEPAPVPERALRFKEAPGLLEEAQAWQFRPVPRMRTVTALVPRVVMRPIPGPPRAPTGLVQPFQNAVFMPPPPQHGFPAVSSPLPTLVSFPNSGASPL